MSALPSILSFMYLAKLVSQGCGELGHLAEIVSADRPHHLHLEVSQSRMLEKLFSQDCVAALDRSLSMWSTTLLVSCSTTTWVLHAAEIGLHPSCPRRRVQGSLLPEREQLRLQFGEQRLNARIL